MRCCLYCRGPVDDARVVADSVWGRAAWKTLYGEDVTELPTCSDRCTFELGFRLGGELKAKWAAEAAKKGPPESGA